MTKRLLLTSSFKDVAELLPQLEEDLSGKKVTFIPTASVVEKVTFYVKSGKKALEKMGLIVEELELTTASAEEVVAKIANNDIIYVTGGNTFFLMQELKRTGADKLIISEVNAGKVYIGESAGAIVTAPSIDYAKTMDEPEKAPELDNFQGLRLVDFYTVPHYTNQPFKKVAHQIVEDYEAEFELQVISNDEAILVKGKDHTLVST